MTLGRRIYFSSLMLLIVATAAGSFANGVFFLTQPYQRNYGEGLVAWQAAHITDPQRAYAPLDRYPFVVFQYPPLFHLAVRALARLARTPDLLAAGRAVSLISAAILCVVAGWATFRATPRRVGIDKRILAAAFAGALPTAFYNFDWAWLARVDLLAVLLSFSAVAIFAAWPRSVPVQVMASILTIAALFTRQTALAAPATCLLVAWLMDRKIFVRMLMVMGTLGGAAFGLLEWRTHGQAYFHLIRYNQVAFSPFRAGQGILMNVRHVVGPLLLAAGVSFPKVRAAGGLALRGRWTLLSKNLSANGYRRGVVLFAIYGIVAALTALTFGKEGSDVNYFLEWNVALTPLVGILLFRAVFAARGLLRWQPLTVTALAVPLLLLETGFDRARDGWLRALHGPLPADVEAAEVYHRMLATVQKSGGLVFSEDMNLLYQAGQDIPAEPAMIQCLVKARLWDETPLARMIREHQFALIIAQGGFSPERYSPSLISVISSFYELTSTAGEYKLYRPRAGPGN